MNHLYNTLTSYAVMKRVYAIAYDQKWPTKWLVIRIPKKWEAYVSWGDDIYFGLTDGRITLEYVEGEEITYEFI